MADNPLSVDVVPEPPIPQGSIDEEQTVGQRQNTGEQTIMQRMIDRDTHIPISDLKLNHFLVQLAGEITDGDLESMKMIFSGDGGIGAGVLSKIKTPLELFTILRKRGFLNRDNLLHLQSALKTINRMDLVKKGAEYAQSIDNVLHFYPASDQPENGYRFVKLHIRGRNYQDTNRDHIQQIRAQFAEVLFVPPQFIIIAGIEPATSLILTLQIPESFVALLIDMLETNVDQSHFKDIGVDCIEIQHIDALFQLSDTDEATITVREQHKKLYNVYQQLENTKKQLEAYEIEQLELNSRLEDFEKESFQREALLKTMETKFIHSRDDSESSTSYSDDLNEFQKQLQRPELKSYDKALILSLIDINTKVVAYAVSEGYKLMEEKMKLAIKELEAKLLPLQFELLKSRAFSDPDSFEKMILESFRKLEEALSGSHQVTIEINEQFLQILKKISRGLRYREREKLEREYTWVPNDTLKQAMDSDSSFFLAGIFHKEIQTTKTLVDPELFIPQCLDKVGRSDLKTKFFSSLEAARKTAAEGMKKRNRQRTRSLERNEDDADVRFKKDQVQKMADQVAKMHEIIVSAHESFQSPSYVGLPPKSKRSLFESMNSDGFVLR